MGWVWLVTFEASMDPEKEQNRKLKFLQNSVACAAEHAIWGSRKGTCEEAGKHAASLAGAELTAGELAGLVAL